ncbi:MAG: HAD hydrolase-like protein [Chitinivibrionales bacterium]|nr:HAD hydrolase-like protein [Chitinivibrionales bacterium]MBD3358822.1 HAD hydrolase-like protein [Chitinivibrionales bacterium]
MTAIIFDLDGTLLDTLEDIADATNKVLSRNGFPIHSVVSYRHFVGNGARALVYRALPEERRTNELIKSCLNEFRAEYAENWNRKTHVYPEIHELLENLASLNIPFSINTNKPQPHAEKAVEGYLRAHAFAGVTGQREGVPLKPEPAGALQLAEIMGSEPTDTYFVGDSSVDIRTARAAAMPSVGVTWGFRTERELREEGALHIVHNPLEIVPLVSTTCSR